MNAFKTEFLWVITHYANPSKADALWLEIETAYGHKKRFYHTLSHLDHFFNMLISVKNQFKNWDTVIIAIAYHDIVYSAVKSNNEEKSAQTAVERLSKINFPNDQIQFCETLILATKKHLPAGEEVNLFTDADLSVLGAKREEYQIYSENVRKEYSVFPDLIYNPGRKKVLMHFLAMERIYKTEYFFNQLEDQARKNLEWELNALK